MLQLTIFFTNVINVTIFWMTKLQSDSNKLTMLLCVLVVVYSSSCTRCRVLVVVYSSLCTRGCVLVVVYCRRVLLCGNMDDIWVLCWWQSDKWNMNEWMSRECYPNVTRMLPNCHPLAHRYNQWNYVLNFFGWQSNSNKLTKSPSSSTSMLSW